MRARFYLEFQFDAQLSCNCSARTIRPSRRKEVAQNRNGAVVQCASFVFPKLATQRERRSRAIILTTSNSTSFLDSFFAMLVSSFD